MQTRQLGQRLFQFVENELQPRLKKKGLGFADSPVSAQLVGWIIRRESEGIYTRHDTREFLDQVFAR